MCIFSPIVISLMLNAILLLRLHLELVSNGHFLCWSHDSTCGRSVFAKLFLMEAISERDAREGPNLLCSLSAVFVFVNNARDGMDLDGYHAPIDLTTGSSRPNIESESHKTGNFLSILSTVIVRILTESTMPKCRLTE